MRQWVATSKYATLGLDIAVPIGLCIWAGHWCDRRFGTGYWLMLVGLALGVAVAVRTLQKTTQELELAAREQDRADARSRGGKGDDS